MMDQQQARPLIRDVRRCSAVNRRGEPCGRAAIKGGTVCLSHGGRAPQVRAAAKRRLEHDAVIDAVARFAVPIETTPSAALLRLLYSAAGRVAWITDQIRRHEPGHGVVIEVDRMAANGPTRPHGVPDGNPALLLVERPSREAVRLVENPLLALLRAEEKHLADIATACHRAGIEEARIDLHRTVADLLVATLARVLPELGVRHDDPHIIDVVSRALASGGGT